MSNNQLSEKLLNKLECRAGDVLSQDHLISAQLKTTKTRQGVYPLAGFLRGALN